MNDQYRQVFETFPIIETERLKLRSLALSDAESIYEIRSSRRVNQFIGRPDMTEKEKAEDLIDKCLVAYKNKKGIAWAGQHKTNGSLIGTCGFNSIDFQNNRAEIGGEMSVSHWGKNLAIEAMKEIIHFGFDTLKLHAIEAKVSPHNRSAIYLLEKMHFMKEAHFKDYFYFNNQYHDLAVYTLIR